MDDGSRRARAIARVAARSGGGPLDPVWRVSVHFHPDRLVRDTPIIRAMATEGGYRTQFETGTSTGGLTAYPGGDRWRWESRMFGGTYDHAPAAERPRYGSLNFRRRGVGGSPRFGSAHLRLTAATLDRTTFCYPDSVFSPTTFGVAERASTLVAAARAGRPGDPLDDYVEAHIHGRVVPERDAEALVLDPCYRGTDVERDAARLGCPVEWHDGFALDIDTLRRHPEYRGPEHVTLGASLAVDGRLDPAILGAAARTGRYDDQALKRVWHLLARFGSAGVS